MSPFRLRWLPPQVLLLTWLAESWALQEPLLSDPMALLGPPSGSLSTAALGALGALALLTAAGSDSDPDEPSESRHRSPEDRDRELLEQLQLLVSACPTCDRVLGRDEVWYRAASWMSLRQALPRSPQPCPDCTRNRRPGQS